MKIGIIIHSKTGHWLDILKKRETQISRLLEDFSVV